jgi:hypothetical protein
MNGKERIPGVTNGEDTYVLKLAEFLRGNRKYPPETPFWCDQDKYEKLLEKAKKLLASSQQPFF